MTDVLVREAQVDTGPCVVEIVIPVHNEERDLEASVRRLRTYLDHSFPFTTVITVADNASTDGTWDIASELARTLPGVGAIHLDQKGRGRALRTAWLASDAQIVAYMDVDLSTDLDALLPLVAPLLSGHSHLAIGSRLAEGAQVVRGPKREVISRTYNLILRAVLRNHFSDAQCGFKAIRGDTARLLLPLVDDQEWFFDTELLIQAERRGLRIHEVPVDWVDDPDSRVHLSRTARDDLLGVWRLARRRPCLEPTTATDEGHPSHRTGHTRELGRYTGVGVVSTLAYLVLYLLLRHTVGVFGSNALALALCTVGNTVAQVRFTFVPRTSVRRRRAIVAGMVGFVTGVTFTSLGLGLGQVVGATSPTAEAAAIVLGTAAAALVRFVLLQAWVFRTHARTRPDGGSDTLTAIAA